MEYNYIAIGDTIKALRKKKKLSQNELVDRIRYYGGSISRNTISKIENGDRNFVENVSFRLLLTLSEIFSCDIGHLIGEYDEATIQTHKICEITGLSEQAIANLERYKEYPTIIEFIDTIIANSNVFTTLSHYANEYFDSLYRCKKLKEKYPQHDFEHLHIHLFTGEEDIAVDEKHETEERELHDIYENEVDNVQPLQLYKLQNFFMDFIKAYGKAVLKDGGKNG